MKKYILLFLTLNIVTFSMELTLDKSIKLAEKNNRQLKEKSINVKQKRLNENVKIKNALPSLRAQTTYADHDESKNLNSSFQNGVYLSQSIFTGGELYYNIKSSEALREFEESDYIAQNIDLELEVIQTYINCLQLKKSLNIYEASQKEKKEELKKQQEFYKLSLIDKSEVLKIETSLYQTETLILKTKNNITTQELILKNLLGLDSDESITLKEMDFSSLTIPNIDLKKDTEKALANSTLSKKLDKNILISEYNVKSNRSVFLPKVDLEYGYESLDESSFSKSNNDWEWRVGVTFKWDIFNFGSGIDSYKESTLEIEKQRILKIDSLETLKREIKTAYLDLITSKDIIVTNEKALLTALETFNIDKEKFSNRIIDSVDFLKSESQLREAQITHINSQLDYFLYYQQYLSLLK